MNLEINPYELLGLSPKSNFSELKKAYYELSLLCHPDRGGNSKEMIIIHNSYQYIKKQFENCNKNCNLENTYENMEKEFEIFCNKQEKEPPPFRDIFNETNDFIKDFNKKFTENKNRINSINPFEKGYGNLMESSDLKDSDIKNYKEYENENISQPLKTNFNNQIIHYEDPLYLPDNYGKNYDLHTKEINDFTHNDNNLQMSDYKLAFNNSDKNLEEILNIDIKPKTLGDLIKERSNIYTNENIDNSTTIIQCFNTRKGLNSTLIQKNYRRYISQKRFEIIKYYDNLNKTNYFLDSYSIQIQKIFRGFLSKKEVEELKLNKEIKEIENKIHKLKNKKREKYNFNH